ncbi:MAG: hypothetical protein IJV31_06080 [Clostridia bacterium]|nr:hypothetical protein [Clostridia bacterium]
MKKENGAIKLITLVSAILILILVLFAVFIWQRIKMNKMSSNNISSKSTGNETKKEEEDEKLTEIKIQTESDFTYSFLKLENKKTNMIYSPLSIKYGLKMLQEGAEGTTYTQINDVVGNLKLPTYKNVQNSLSLANGIFIKDTFFNAVKQTYKDTLTNKYNAEIMQDKFENPNNINKWIENKTLGIIKDMLKPSDISPDTQLALINALAIDMEWDEQFDAKDTYGNTFYLTNNKQMQATTMSKETTSEGVSYYLGKDITALTMDLKEYDGTKLEFLAIMPNENLSEYIRLLTNDEINKIDKNLKLASKEKAGVKITIPKFSYEYDLNFKEDLMKLGISDAFSENTAKFSNIANVPLYVSKALHKANIDFTEKGIKAAAVTVFTMDENAMIMEQKPVEVNINKPFLFLIRDKQTKEVWFTGTVFEPNSWNNDKAEYEIR